MYILTGVDCIVQNDLYGRQWLAGFVFDTYGINVSSISCQLIFLNLIDYDTRSQYTLKTLLIYNVRFRGYTNDMYYHFRGCTYDIEFHFRGYTLNLPHGTKCIS